MIHEIKQWLLEFEHGDALSDAEINHQETRLGWPLSPQLRELYATCNGVRMNLPSGSDSLKIVPLQEINRVRAYIYGPNGDTASYGPGTVFLLCEYGETDAIGFDVATLVQGSLEHPIVDCCHETFAWNGPESVIASSLDEFLAALKTNSLSFYWLRSTPDVG